MIPYDFFRVRICIFSLCYRQSQGWEGNTYFSHFRKMWKLASAHKRRKDNLRIRKKYPVDISLRQIPFSLSLFHSLSLFLPRSLFPSFSFHSPSGSLLLQLTYSRRYLGFVLHFVAYQNLETSVTGCHAHEYQKNEPTLLKYN